MKKSIFALLIMLSCMFCLSCGDKSESEYFNDYLKKFHSIEIPAEEHTFVVFITDGCHGCVSRIMQMICAKNYIRPTTTLIVSHSGKEVPANLSHFTNQSNVLFEHENQFQNYGMSASSTMVILTKNKEITKTISIEFDNLDEIKEYL
jgi:hypothetical protein